MNDKLEQDVIETVELDNVLDDSWNGFNERYIEDETKVLKAMTDLQLRKEGEEKGITNYLTMTREELLNILIEYVKKEVEEAYLPEGDNE